MVSSWPHQVLGSALGTDELSLSLGSVREMMVICVEKDWKGREIGF